MAGGVHRVGALGRGRALRAAVLTAVALVLVAVSAHLLLRLGATWEYSAIRLQRSFVLAAGAPLYPSPAEHAVLNTIYGPVGALAYLPATAAATPARAILAGQLLSVLFVLLPAAAFLLRAAPGRRALTAAGLLCFLAVTLDAWPLAYAAFTVHVDAPALALAAIACLALSRGRGASAPAVAACAAVLAVWTKQVMVPLVPALVLWAGLTAGWPAARRLLAWLAAAGSALSAAVILLFGPLDRIWLYLVTVPGRHGRWPSADALPAAAGAMAAETASVWALALLAAALEMRRARTAGLGLRGWLRARPAAGLCALAALALLPTSVLGRVKAGGDANALAYLAYFLLLFATVSLVRLAAAGGAPTARAARLGLGLALAVLAPMLALVQEPGSLTRIAPATALDAWGPEVAYRYARAHPGEVYFPRLTLVSHLAEGAIYHQGIGLIDLALAGVPVPAANLAAHLPPRLRLIALQENGFQSDFDLLPFGAFSEAGRDPALPGFVVYRRPPPEVPPEPAGGVG